MGANGQHAQAQVGLAGIHVSGANGTGLGHRIQHEGALKCLLAVPLVGALVEALLLLLLVAVLFRRRFG